MEKSYIWTLPTRIFHLLFALFICFAFVTDDDRLLTYHAIIGYFILILLIFRLVWGIIGPKYSLFKDFPLGIDNVKKFASSMLSGKSEYTGHNPIASYVMIGMLVVAFMTILSGILTYGIQEGKGILSFLNMSLFNKMDIFEEIHEFFANLLIVLIITHISGVILDKILHKRNKTLNSIFTGYKMTTEYENIQLNIYQKLVALIIFLCLIVFLAFNISTPKNILTASIYDKINYKQENALFVSECASCHILYPPNILPQKSWVAMMSDLENHFGDDASLSEKDNQEILTYLVNNSAENSTKEVSIKILQYAQKHSDKEILAFSQTGFWKDTHLSIPENVFRQDTIKNKSNCKACHIDIEEGLIEDDKIKNINSFIG